MHWRVGREPPATVLSDQLVSSEFNSERLSCDLIDLVIFDLLFFIGASICTLGVLRVSKSS